MSNYKLPPLLENNANDLMPISFIERTAKAYHPWIYNRVCQTFMDLDKEFPGKTEVTVLEFMQHYLPRGYLKPCGNAIDVPAYVMEALVNTVLYEVEREKYRFMQRKTDPFKELDWIAGAGSVYTWF